jgi:RND family efflux transporter MFP subunit
MNHEIFLMPRFPRRNQPASSRIHIVKVAGKWMISGLALAMMPWFFAACRRGPGAGQNKNHEPVERLVQVAVVAEGEVIREYEGPAEVRARSRAQITATIPERIRSVFVEVGDTVSAGQTLILLDSADAERQVALARAQLDSASAQLKKAETGPRAQEVREVEAMYEKARKDFERAEQLLSQGAISQEVYDGLKAAYEAAESRRSLIKEGTRAEDVESARSAVKAAKAQLDLALSRLEQMTIRAPFRGTVVSKSASVGDYAAPGMPLLVIDSADPPKVVLALPFELVRSLKAGEKGTFVPSGGSSEYPVFVANVGKAGGSALLFPVELEFATRETPPSGVSGKIRLPVARQFGLKVPRSAVIQRENKWWVFKLSGNVVQRTEVTVGLEGTDSVLITGGLSAGDRVVISDVEFLKDEERVKVQDEGAG